MSTFGAIKNFLKSSRRLDRYIFIAGIALALSLLLGSLIAQRNRDFLIQRTNDDIKNFSDLSTKSIIDSYELYYNSGYSKFKEIIDENMRFSPNISKFQIINTKGEIIFDSSETNEKNSGGKITDQEIIEMGKKLEPSYIFKKNDSRRFDQVVYPYVEEWGKHSYSVLYFVNYKKADKDIASFRTWIILSVTFLVIVSMAVIMAAIASKELVLKKEEKEELEALNKQKEEFLMLVTHNLRTPLARLDLFVSQAKKEKDPEKIKELFSSTDISVQELNKLVKKVITIISIISSEQEIALKKESIEEILQKTVSDFETKTKNSKIKVNIEIDKNIPQIEVDEDKIKSVLVTFLENAIAFTKPGGKITVDAHKEHRSIKVSVSDNGVGISSKNKFRLFQIFGRATDVLTYDYPGTGLSLFMSRLIIEAHHGKIWFESEEGRGSTFYFRLPIG